MNEMLAAIWQILLGSFSRASSDVRGGCALFGALLVCSAAYRLRLGRALQGTHFGLVAPLRTVLQKGSMDVLVALLGAALVCPGLLMTESESHGRLGILIGLQPLLFLFGLLCQVQLRVLVATGSGLTVELLREGIDAGMLRVSRQWLDTADFFFIASPSILFWGLYFSPFEVHAWLFAGVLVAATALVSCGSLSPKSQLSPAFARHPLLFFAADALRTYRSAAKSRPLEPTPGQPTPGHDAEGEPLHDIGPSVEQEPSASPALLSPTFTHTQDERLTNKHVPVPEASIDRRQNVLLIVMESAGFEYALNPLPDGRIVMPTVEKLGRQGYLLRNHYSTGNSSPRALFSLFSGLYPLPDPAVFEVREDIHIPSIASFLGDDYESFLVTPGSVSWYFPFSFLKHSGLREIWDRDSLPLAAPLAPTARACKETDAVDFFLQRLDEAAAGERPFFGVYCSYLAHWPYEDQGPPHLVPPGPPLASYYNNLHFLDQQIERIIAHCENKGVLDRTLIVLVGDHGEAFGQHPGNYVHSLASYNENLRTPMVFYHKELFPPRVIMAPTSHVDLLPTLLDALGRPYDPALIQGESLYQDRFRRKYIFMYGNENTVSSVSEGGIKVQASFKHDRCWAFDLEADLEERRKLSCRRYREQYAALLAFREHQRSILPRYNQSLQLLTPLSSQANA